MSTKPPTKLPSLTDDWAKVPTGKTESAPELDEDAEDFLEGALATDVKHPSDSLHGLAAVPGIDLKESNDDEELKPEDPKLDDSLWENFVGGDRK
jgi:hypothetical protein